MPQAPWAEKPNFDGIVLTRWRDDWTGRDLGELSVDFVHSSQPPSPPLHASILPNATDSYHVRIRRRGRSLSVEISDDGLSLRPFGNYTFGREIDGSSQFVLLTGTAFATFDAFADYEFIRLRKDVER